MSAPRGKPDLEDVEQAWVARQTALDRQAQLEPDPVFYTVQFRRWLASQQEQALREAALALERRAGQFTSMPGDRHVRRTHNDIARWLRDRGRRLRSSPAAGRPVA